MQNVSCDLLTGPNDCWSGFDLAAQWREGEGVTLLLGGELSRAALPTLQASKHEAGAQGALLAPELIYGECRASIRLQCNGKVNLYDRVMLMTKETKQPNKLFQNTVLTQISPPATGPVQ